MAAQVLMLFQHPADAEAFQQYFHSAHTAQLNAIPDVRGISIASGDIRTPNGPAPYDQVTTLTFDSMDDLTSAMSSAEGQAALRDLTSFATDGVTVLMYETERVRPGPS